MYVYTYVYTQFHENETKQVIMHKDKKLVRYVNMENRQNIEFKVRSSDSSSV